MESDLYVIKYFSQRALNLETLVSENIVLSPRQQPSLTVLTTFHCDAFAGPVDMEDV